MPIFARLHHMNGTIDNATHVSSLDHQHVMLHHESFKTDVTGMVRQYSLHAGEPPIEIQPEHREYFETLLDQGDHGALACEVYEADAARPVPAPPTRNLGGTATGAELDALRREMATKDEMMARMVDQMAQMNVAIQALAKPTVAPPAPIPASFPLPGGVAAGANPPLAPQPPARDLSQPPAGARQPAADVPSDADVMAATAHRTAVQSGLRDKRPKGGA